MKTDQHTQEGVFHYIQKEAEHSLYRNGKVYTRRLPDGDDNDWVGVDLEPSAMQVLDARSKEWEGRCTLERNGFEIWDDPIGDTTLDFLDNTQIATRYYPHCAELVKKATGAMQVFAFDHNVRSAAGKASKKKLNGGQGVQGPIHVVHGDYTLTSSKQRLRDLAAPPKKNDTAASILAPGESLLDADHVEQTLAKGRFAIINVWRNITSEPVSVHPLALCDATSVEIEDLVVFEIRYEDRTGENYFAKQSDRHRWFYYPAMLRDEALLIKQWDSAGHFAHSDGALPDHNDSSTPCTFSFHSAFEDPSTPDDAPDRCSIEVRCIAMFE